MLSEVNHFTRHLCKETDFNFEREIPMMEFKKLWHVIEELFYKRSEAAGCKLRHQSAGKNMSVGILGNQYWRRPRPGAIARKLELTE